MNQDISFFSDFVNTMRRMVRNVLKTFSPYLPEEYMARPDYLDRVDRVIISPMVNTRQWIQMILQRSQSLSDIIKPRSRPYVAVGTFTDDEFRILIFEGHETSSHLKLPRDAFPESGFYHFTLSSLGEDEFGINFDEGNDYQINPYEPDTAYAVPLTASERKALREYFRMHVRYEDAVRY